MGENKNQHFVPQYLFRNFSSNKRSINILLRKNGKIIQQAQIKGQCSKNNFYGSIEIENLFSKLEGQHSLILRDILSMNSQEEFMKHYNNYDKENSDIKINPNILILLQAIIFQKNRTELEAQKQSLMFGKIVKELFVRDMELQDKNEITKYKDYFKIDVDLTKTVLMMIETSSKVVGLIVDLGVYILRNKTNTEFIFSDSPVTLYNKHYINVHLRGVLGLQTPGLMIFYPISSDTCILLLDENIYNGSLIGNNFFEIENDFDVTSINKLQLHHSSNAVYFSEEMNQKYIKKLWKQERSSLKSLNINFNVAPAIDHNGIAMGDVMHSFEPQIPYRLNLSFLSSEILDDKHYTCSCRTPELVEDIKEYLFNNTKK